MWNLRKWYTWNYLPNRNGVTDGKNKFMVSKGEKVGRGINWDVGIDIHTLLCIK